MDNGSQWQKRRNKRRMVGKLLWKNDCFEQRNFFDLYQKWITRDANYAVC